ncbi:MAG: SIS domain-containing protein, partial [Candidatus Omnitrophota bacterium]|nr:SIS domain-containing protein [Candidatus Omnitrophota bacterium]
MKKDISGYFSALKGLFDGVAVTGTGAKEYGFYEAVEKAVRTLTESASRGGKVLFIGNGASASISSHMAIDFWKNAGIRAMAFNDSSLLTCISNDFGYKHV